MRVLDTNVIVSTEIATIRRFLELLTPDLQRR